MNLRTRVADAFDRAFSLLGLVFLAWIVAATAYSAAFSPSCEETRSLDECEGIRLDLQRENGPDVY